MYSIVCVFVCGKGGSNVYTLLCEIKCADNYNPKYLGLSFRGCVDVRVGVCVNVYEGERGRIRECVWANCT